MTESVTLRIELESKIMLHSLDLCFFCELKANPSHRDNRVAALLNGAILAPAKFAQVHPLRCDDGTYPADFQFPKTVEAMKILDSEWPIHATIDKPRGQADF